MDERLAARYGSVEGAEAYRRKYERSVWRRWSSRRELGLVHDLVAALGPGLRSALDVPCAAGRLVPALASLAGRVTAVDASEAMVDVARKALAAEIAAGKATVELGLAEALPHEDGSFDVAVCWRLLHHLTDGALRARILRELARVSRRGVVVSFADAGTWKARLQRLRRRKRRCVKWTPDEFAAEAKVAGLRVVRTGRVSSAFSLLAGALLIRG